MENNILITMSKHKYLDDLLTTSIRPMEWTKEEMLFKRKVYYSLELIHEVLNGK